MAGVEPLELRCEHLRLEADGAARDGQAVAGRLRTSAGDGGHERQRGKTTEETALRCAAAAGCAHVSIVT
jgi:hypothetical protein